MEQTSQSVATRIEDAQTVEQHAVPKITIGMPAYNEAEAIASVVSRVLDVAAGLDGPVEILVVDDASTDGTSEILSDLSTRSPGLIRVIRHPYNKGNGGSVKTAVREARRERLVIMDADGQHNPDDIPRLLAELAEHDMAVGARTAQSVGDWHRNLGNFFFKRLVSYLTQVKILDLTSGFRAFKTPMIRSFAHLLPNGFSYPATSTMAFIKAGYSVTFVPIVTARRSGRSKLRPIHDGVRFLFIILKMIVLFEPFRVFLPAAGVLILLGLASFAFTVFDERRLHIPNSAVFLSVSALLVFLIGLVAEQIAELRMSIRSKDQ